MKQLIKSKKNDKSTISVSLGNAESINDSASDSNGIVNL